MDADGKTALHVAAAFNTVYALAYFMEHTSMDVSARDLKGKTALLIAVKYGNLEAVKVLQGVKPSVLDDVDFEGNSSLICAILHNQSKIAEFLLEQPALEINSKNSLGFTAFDLAYHKQDKKIIEIITSKKKELAFDQNKELSPKPELQNTSQQHFLTKFNFHLEFDHQNFVTSFLDQSPN